MSISHSDNLLSSLPVSGRAPISGLESKPSIEEFARKRMGVICAIATLLSAFLVFQVQPLVSKSILPWFGGGPSVWTTCLVFFQVALLAGYAYAHYLCRFFSIRNQALIHSGLVVAAVCFLPITPGDDLKPLTSAQPGSNIVWLLLLNVAAPYVLLSATSPLIQSWYGWANQNKIPYRLYALSNIGSLTALLSYPFLVEPALSIDLQGIIWSIGFVGFGGCCLFLTIAISGSRSLQLPATREKETEGSGVSRITWFKWCLLSGLGSMALVTITNEICQEITVAPLLWIIPLSLYLVTFIIGFEKPSWYLARWWSLACLLLVLSAIVYRCDAWTLFDDLLEYSGINVEWFYENPFVEAGLMVAILFCFCMVCHGELYQRRPTRSHLTSFYFALASGGALGGLFVSVVCPQLFSELVETELVLLTAFVISAVVVWTDGCRRWRIPQAFVGCLVGVLVTITLYFVVSQSIAASDGESLIRVRNFYGVLRVESLADENGRARVLYHGRTLHGFQYYSDELADRPTTYYDPDSGVGLAINQLGKTGPQRVGAVGLGVGTIAAYGRPGDQYDFFEINPAVIDIAEHAFSYLDRSAAETSVQLGDARILIEQTPSDQYDILVLDAFSGDAIPMHLLTLEAFDEYDRCLKQDGVIAVHVSNRYLNLPPVVVAAAQHLNMQCLQIETEETEAENSAGSSWILVTRNSDFLNAEAIGAAPGRHPLRDVSPISWTDQHSSLIDVFK